MRTLILAAIVSICSIIVSSCDSRPKSRIELKFQNYVNENFGNPKDLIEVISIVQTDSFDVLQSIDKIDEVSLDSLQQILIEHTERLTYLVPKLPSPKSEEIGKKLRPLILEICTTLSSDMRTYNSKKKDLKIMAEGIDSTMAVARNYTIKARIKKDGEIVVRDYYATDCFLIDSVIVSTTPIKIVDLPSQASEIMTTINDFLDVIGKQVTYNKRLLNIIKECELYAY